MAKVHFLDGGHLYYEGFDSIIYAVQENTTKAHSLD